MHWPVVGLTVEFNTAEWPSTDRLPEMESNFCC